jgi:hypothetical protein
LKDDKARPYAAPNPAEFVHDIRYSQNWEKGWISKVFRGDKKLHYGEIFNLEIVDIFQIRSRFVTMRFSGTLFFARPFGSAF